MPLGNYFFQTQMDRLVNTFGEKAYPKPRIELLYGIVKNEDEPAFASFVSGCILNSKFPPIGPDFREFVNNQEDRRRRNMPSIDNGTQWNNEESIFSKEEISQHFQVMKDVMSGKITPKQALEYADCVKAALKEYGIKYET